MLDLAYTLGHRDAIDDAAKLVLEAEHTKIATVNDKNIGPFGDGDSMSNEHAWLAGWYATRLHAVDVIELERSKKMDKAYVKSECGALVSARMQKRNGLPRDSKKAFLGASGVSAYWRSDVLLTRR